MNASFTFSMCSIFYSILLMFSFFSKKKIMLVENTIYGYLIITNLIGTILGTSCYFTIQNMNKIPLINNIVSYGMIIYFLSWISLFTLYVFIISYDKESKSKNDFDKFYKKLKSIFKIIYIICAIVIIVLPLYYHNENGVIYSYGPSATFMYLAFVGFVISFFVAIFKSKNKFKNRKLIPVVVFSILGIFIAIIQRLNPGLLLMTAMETFITFLMYFTIENPDVNMLNELYKNKELMEQSYEDKYNFLFEMTQEARSPIVDINSVTRELLNEDVSDSVKEKINYLNVLTRRLDFSINNVLNISSLDVSKVKIINSKYELDKICDDVVTKIKPSVKPGVNFTIEYPKQIPILYGDYMKLRQILYSLLINSCKNTINGSINLKVNLIEKYDVARIIFNISDTGSGMEIDKINELLSTTGELDKEELENLDTKEYNVKVCQKVIKIMGGNLMIKSNVGEGTEINLTVDQRVYHEKDKSILNQYENDIANFKKVLLIAQNKELINTIKKYLVKNNMTVSTLYYGKDGVDKVKSGKNYDFILIEDEMKEISGYMTLKELKNIKNFDIPCIIMLNKDKENIKEHFIEDGFSDYLITNNIENDIEKIINKY